MKEVSGSFESVLEKWLSWNDADEELTVKLFDAQDDPDAIEQLLDEVDGLRRDAVADSRRLLGRS